MLSKEELKSYCINTKDTKDGGFDCNCNCHNDTHPSWHWKIGNVGWIGRCKVCGAKGSDFAKAAGFPVSQLFADSKPLTERMPSRKYGYEKNGEWISGTKDIDTSLSVFCNVSIEKLKKSATEGSIICYAEGEKDCRTLGKYGFVAFTFGGANDIKGEVFKYLRKAKLVIFGDNDTQGIDSANKKQKYFRDIGGYAVVIIPSEEAKGDITDYMASHTKEELQALIDNSMQEIKGIPLQETVSEKTEDEAVDLMQFHLVAENGKITGVYHNAIFEYIKKKYDLFVVGGTPYIYGSGYYKADVTGARLKSIIRKLIYPQFIKSTTINNIYTLFLQDISLEVQFEQLNNYPSHWICFKNGMYDTKEKYLLPHSPKYRAINQIPHNYNHNLKYKGDKTEEYLNFICEDVDSREMLLQFIGYSLTKDVGQQKFLVLNGEGGTGKSTVIRLIEALAGSNNVSNISLTDLQQRFASFGLMGKLLNSCADLEISALEDTSIIKKILGEDTLRAEQKGRDAISFKSYAKLIFSTNELPLVKSEKTNGFYRRLLVLTMNKVPVKKNPNLFQELVQEIDYLLQLSVQAVERMYQNGTVIVSEASEKAVLQLRADSDTVEAFLQEICSDNEKGRIERTDLYKKYADYCEETDRQSLTKNNFYKSMRVKGYEEFKTNGYRYFKGISYSKDCPLDALDNALNKSESGFMSITQEQLKDLPFV